MPFKKITALLSILALISPLQSLAATRSRAETSCTPTRLVGFAWNGAKEELRSIDPCTGATTPIGIVPELRYLGPSATNRAKDTIFVAGSTENTGLYLFSVKVQSASTTRVALDRGYHRLFVRSDDTLVGLAWNFTTESEELRQINIVNGSSTVINTIPALESFITDAATIDTTTDTIVLYGNLKGQTGNYIFTINAINGQVLRITRMSQWMSVLHMDYRTEKARRLVGLRWNGFEEELHVIKPVRGITQRLGIVEDLAYLSLYGSDVDQTNHILYEIGTTAVVPDPLRLFAIELKSGAPTTNVVLDHVVSNIFVIP